MKAALRRFDDKAERLLGVVMEVDEGSGVLTAFTCRLGAVSLMERVEIHRLA